MAKVYLGLGTNLGDKEQNLHIAVDKIQERIGKVISLSAFYATEPWGFVSDNIFLNAACCAETVLSPLEVLNETQLIEQEIGRLQKSADDGSYTDRLIDVDLLLYDDLKMNSDSLTLPHPLMAKRLFVMEPLAEIVPNMIHPALGKTIKDLLSELIGE